MPLQPNHSLPYIPLSLFVRFYVKPTTIIDHFHPSTRHLPNFWLTVLSYSATAHPLQLLVLYLMSMYNTNLSLSRRVTSQLCELQPPPSHNLRVTCFHSNLVRFPFTHFRSTTSFGSQTSDLRDGFNIQFQFHFKLLLNGLINFYFEYSLRFAKNYVY